MTPWRERLGIGVTRVYVTYTANYFLPDGPQLNRHSKLQCHVQILQMYNRDERYTYITIQSISALNWMSIRSNSCTAWADDICSRFFSSKSYTMHFNIIVNLSRWYQICCGKNAWICDQETLTNMYGLLNTKQAKKDIRKNNYFGGISFWMTWIFSSAVAAIMLPIVLSLS